MLLAIPMDIGRYHAVGDADGVSVGTMLSTALMKHGSVQMLSAMADGVWGRWSSIEVSLGPMMYLLNSNSAATDSRGC